MSCVALTRPSALTTNPNRPPRERDDLRGVCAAQGDGGALEGMEPIEMRLAEAPLGRRDMARGAVLVVSAVASTTFGTAPLRILAHHHVRGDKRLCKETAPPGGRLPSKHLPHLHC